MIFSPETVAGLIKARDELRRMLAGIEALIGDAPPPPVAAPARTKSAPAASTNGKPRGAQGLAILAAMKRGEDYSVAELAEQMGVDPKRLGVMLCYLHSQERIQRVDAGVYRRP